jgi:hypothetical protein
MLWRFLRDEDPESGSARGGDVRNKSRHWSPPPILVFAPTPPSGARFSAAARSIEEVLHCRRRPCFQESQGTVAKTTELTEKTLQALTTQISSEIEKRWIQAIPKRQKKVTSFLMLPMDNTSPSRCPPADLSIGLRIFVKFRIWPNLRFKDACE